MIFRILIEESGATVSVEEDENVLFTVTVADADEAAALAEKGMIDGIEAIRPAGPVVEPEVAKSKKKT